MSSSSLSRIISPTVLLYTFFAVSQVGRGAYLATGDEPAAFNLVNAFGFVWILGWWLLRDSRKRGIALIYDIGLYLYLAWPIVMTYHLLKSRGAKGLLVIVGFVCVYVGALIAGIALYFLFTPNAG